MGLGGGEVVVHRDDLARLDEDLGQQVFGRSALVGGYVVLEAQHVLDGRRQLVVALAAGIGVVGDHHGRQLVVAHGVGAAVGQHVDEDVPGPQQERVVARFFDGLEPLRGPAEGVVFCTMRTLCISMGIDLAAGQFDFHRGLLWNEILRQTENGPR